MKKSPAQTYNEISKDKLSYDFLRNKLKLKQLEVRQDFQTRFPEVDKILTERCVDLSRVREHSSKILSAGVLTGSLLLTPPSGIKSLPPPQELLEDLSKDINKPDFPQEILVKALKVYLPQKVRPLTREEERYLENTFEKVVNIKAKANLEGEHLNTTYGLIGAEQHLQRYPGDYLANHTPFLKEGIAPGLGAWGYFASSKAALTPDLVETEKWYAVVQTLYLPDWARRQPYLRDWYKYRKVLIVNTNNGNAVVAAVADAGPAAWTGKHYGGSPEVMEYLGGPRYKKGPVIVFFVDDPENKIPLGPVEYNKYNLSENLIVKI